MLANPLCCQLGQRQRMYPDRLMYSDRLKRREFITLLGAAAAAWPLAARAQQGSRMRRIGVLMQFAENDPVATAQLSGFMQGLAESGWTDGRNARMELR